MKAENGTRKAESPRSSAFIYHLAFIIYHSVLVLTLGSSVALAGKFTRVATIGQPAATFADLPGTDGKQHSLKDYQQAKLVVVVFTCNHCPVAASYESRLKQLARDFAPRGVQFVAINSSLLPADSLAEMKRRAEQAGFDFPYLFDEQQSVGKAFGAKVTPEIFVLDKDRRFAYLGAIDDDWHDAEQVKHHYLRDALEALLADKQPDQPETRPAGCGIQYESQ
jgi:peroxiredoxin